MSHTAAALAEATREMDSGRAGYLSVPPLELLRERVASATDHVPFYRELYAAHLPIPPRADDEFLAWFAELPVVSKSQLQAAGTAALRNPAYSLPDLVRKPTSGSTGVPFVLYLDRTVTDLRKWRFQRPHQVAVGEPASRLVFLFPWDFVARSPRRESRVATTGERLEPATTAPAAADGDAPEAAPAAAGPRQAMEPVFRAASKRSRAAKRERTETQAPAGLDPEPADEPIADRPFTVNSLLPPDQHYEAFAQLEPASLIGFASTIAALARWMRRENRSLPSVRQVWTTSEVLAPEAADAIRETLGCEPLTIYASNEFGFMAWQDSPGSSLCFDSDRLFVETLSRESPLPAAPDELARIVGTDLLSDAMPLIRYDIGDIARPAPPVRVEAGPVCFAVQSLQGKEADLIETASGRALGTFHLLGSLKDTLPNAQYRLVAIGARRYVLQYRPGVGFAAEDLVTASETLEEILGDGAAVIVQEVRAIEREPSGKLRPIVNLETVVRAQRIRLAAHLGVLPCLDGGLRATAAPLVGHALAAVLPTFDGADDLAEEQELYADLAVDSLRFVEIVQALEEELGRPFDDEDLLDADIITVGDLVSFVESKLRAPPGAQPTTPVG